MYNASVGSACGNAADNEFCDQQALQQAVVTVTSLYRKPWNRLTFNLSLRMQPYDELERCRNSAEASSPASGTL